MIDLAVRHSLPENLLAVRRRLAAAAERAGPSGRDPASIALVGVTKTVEPERALALARLGLDDLGESRAEALETKVAAVAAAADAPRVRWHFVGHLQRNKARRVVLAADAIHSVDSTALVATLARLAKELGRSPELFLEVKLGDEPTRTGLAPSELLRVVDAAAEHPELRLAGLMTIAPLVVAGDGSPADGRAAARVAFRELATIARSLASRAETARRFEEGRVRLSMGMSDDFDVAIEEGSDVVRVGSALFEGLSPAESAS